MRGIEGVDQEDAALKARTRFVSTDAMVPVLLLCALVGGCRSPEPPRQVDPSLATHYAHSEKLRATMLRIERLVHDRQFTENEIDAIRRRQGQQLSDRLGALVETTDELLERSTGVALDDAQRAVFRQLADLLRAEALAIEQLAHTGNAEQLETRFRQMNAVCDACHQLYRSP